MKKTKHFASCVALGLGACFSMQGEGLTPPYSQGFDKSNVLTDFTIIDANNDGVKWKFFTKKMRMLRSVSVAMDDWLITPAMHLEAGQMYEMTVDLATNLGKMYERIEIKMGTEPTAEAMTTMVLEPFDFISGSLERPTVYLVPSTTGDYYVGFHAISDANTQAILLDNISIKGGSSVLVPTTGSLDVAISASDPYQATVSFTAPTVATDGSTLDAAEGLTVEVLLDGVSSKSFTGVQPGQTISYELTLARGEHRFTAHCDNLQGTGKLTLPFTIFAGYAQPVAPEEFVLLPATMDAETAELTWQPTTLDVNGHTFPADYIKYKITDTSLNPAVLVASRLTDTRYSFAAVESGTQEFKTYTLQAVSNDGEASAATTAGPTLMGNPYTLPYSESFADGQPARAFLSEHLTTTNDWECGHDDLFLAGYSAADGDNGFAYMSGSSIGTRGTYLSGRIRLPADAKHLTLSFMYFRQANSNGTEDTTPLDVLVDDADGRHVVATVKANDGAVANGWNRFDISLQQFAGKTIQLGFEAETTIYNFTLLDAISIKDLPAIDLTLASFTAPEKMGVGTPFTLTATVENNGVAATSAYTVELLRSGEVVTTQPGVELPLGHTATFTLTDQFDIFAQDSIPYTCRVSCDGDANPEDNLSQEVKVKCATSNFPVPTGLTAVEGENKAAVLSWQTPDMSMAVPEAVTDDFEQYPSFAYQGFGDWTVHDGDDAPVCPLTGVALPCLSDNDKLAFYIMDVTNEDIAKQMDFEAHSGIKYAATLYPDEYVQADDWLISPLLHTAAQTVTFWARSYYPMYWSDIEILYSTTDNLPQSFISLKNIDQLPNKWQPYSFDLPEGARYFAIRDISEDGYQLFVDDVTFVRADTPVTLTLTGYNIYRDMVKVNATPVAGTTYTDTEATTGTTTYHVSAVYNNGESAPSNGVEFTQLGGLTDVNSSAGVTVSTRGHSIVVSGLHAHEAASLYRPDGTLLRTTISAAGNATFSNLHPGIYLMATPRLTAKVAIR